MIELNLGLGELDEVVKILPQSGVVILQGNLASGKTTLVKAIVKARGIDTEVTSPTFSVMQSYGDKIYHYDIYQNGLDAILQNGLFENLLEEGLHLVEWGDERLEKALENLGEKCVMSPLHHPPVVYFVLGFDHFFIKGASQNQFFMCAGIQYAAFIHNDYFVRVLYGVQVMRNRDNRFIFS